MWASGIYCGRVEQAAPLAHWASGQKVKCTPW